MMRRRGLCAQGESTASAAPPAGHDVPVVAEATWSAPRRSLSRRRRRAGPQGAAQEPCPSLVRKRLACPEATSRDS